MKTIQIGRSDTNNLVIKHSKISSKHCEIRKTDNGLFLIEDLDSTNFTFVNGKRIKQSALNVNDRVELADFQINMPLVLSLFNQTMPPKGLLYDELLTRGADLKKQEALQREEERKQERIYDEFRKLKDIYEKYQRDKKAILRGSTLKSTGLRAGLALIPLVGNALGILSTNVTGNVQEKMLDLDEQFKKEYICPSCFKFLQEPFENLEKRGTCTCRAQWVRK